MVPLTGEVDAVRAIRKLNIPEVCTREEVRQIIGLMDGVTQLIVKLLYGCGLPVIEAARLWVQYIDI